jgi:hydroxymethylpyrimidine/phosphomethylpyrimidine kinase
VSSERKYVLSIAGFDPSGGAGVLADVKTFEQHKLFGLSINTANTLQTPSKFHSVQWTELKDVLNAIDVLLDEYPVKVIKTGIVPSFDFLFEVVKHIKNKNTDIKIIVDPVIKSSTGFDFQKDDVRKNLNDVLKNIFLIIPNLQEAIVLSGNTDAKIAAKELSRYCNVLLKGGHDSSAPGVDYLYTENTCYELKPNLTELNEKHGSGCVLSAAISSNLALEFDLRTSCSKAKEYVEKFLGSNKTLLGYHTA